MTVHSQAFGAFGVAAQWKGGEESRWSRSKKLSSLDPVFRNKVEALERRMTALGHPTRIHYAWRSLTTQAALSSGGSSWVSFSFHNAVNSAGAPAALGADLVHSRVWWGAGSPADKAVADRYFVDLGREAKALGLHWGGDWGSRGREPAASLPGDSYDPAHVQLHPNSRLSAVKAFSLPRLQGAVDTAQQAVQDGSNAINVVIRKPAFKLGLAGTATIGALALAVAVYAISRRSR